MVNINWPLSLGKALAGLLVFGFLSSFLSPITPLLALAWFGVALTTSRSRTARITVAVGVALTAAGCLEMMHWYHLMREMDATHFDAQRYRLSEGDHSYALNQFFNTLGGVLIALAGPPKSPVKPPRTKVHAAIKGTRRDMEGA